MSLGGEFQYRNTGHPNRDGGRAIWVALATVGLVIFGLVMLAIGGLR